MKAIVLDACVLANFALCDTLLRLAEVPRLFEPKWSDQILREAVRTLQTKLGWPLSLCESFESELRGNFSEALVVGYEALIEQMGNDAGDRHVLAAAVWSEAAADRRRSLAELLRILQSTVPAFVEQIQALSK